MKMNRTYNPVFCSDAKPASVDKVLDFWQRFI